MSEKGLVFLTVSKPLGGVTAVSGMLTLTTFCVDADGGTGAGGMPGGMPDMGGAGGMPDMGGAGGPTVEEVD